MQTLCDRAAVAAHVRSFPNARDIVHGRRGITRDTAARLAIFFGTSPDLWINLQARYDAKLAERDLIPQMARKIRRYRAAAA
jgi:addiction module HigA family antidote